jgi:dTDP-4-dehydrorhamnose 3,5-epimerase
MQIDPLGLDGAYLVKPVIFPDERGLFLELLAQPAIQTEVGHPLSVAQVNCSSSRLGTIRGIHATGVPPGEAKYVTCVRGAILDIAVDIRTGSPTFGEHIAVELDDERRHAVYLAEGLGHGFAALTGQATVMYLCSSSYAPGKAISINPLDPELELPWPRDADMLSDKDRGAPTLREAMDLGLLPSYADCQEWYGHLRAKLAG